MKMVRMNYRFENNEASGVDVTFEDYSNERVVYCFTVKLMKEDADLNTSSPGRLAEIAKTKIAELVAE